MWIFDLERNKRCCFYQFLLRNLMSFCDTKEGSSLSGHCYGHWIAMIFFYFSKWFQNISLIRIFPFPPAQILLCHQEKGNSIIIWLSECHLIGLMIINSYDENVTSHLVTHSLSLPLSLTLPSFLLVSYVVCQGKQYISEFNFILNHKFSKLIRWQASTFADTCT